VVEKSFRGEMDIMHKEDKILDMLCEVKQTVSALDERSKNYYEIQHTQGEDIKELYGRVEDTEKDIGLLKRDRWWVGTISSTVGAAIMYLISIFRG